MFEIHAEDQRMLRPNVLPHFARELQSIALGNWGPVAVTMDYDSQEALLIWNPAPSPHSVAVYCIQLSRRTTERVPRNLPGEIVGASRCQRSLSCGHSKHHSL